MKILKPLVAIGIIIITFLLIFLGAYADACETVKTWNQGICSACGGSHEFKCMSGRFNDHFVFQCSDCHKLITLKYNPYPKSEIRK